MQDFNPKFDKFNKCKTTNPENEDRNIYHLLIPFQICIYLQLWSSHFLHKKKLIADKLKAQIDNPKKGKTGKWSTRPKKRFHFLAVQNSSIGDLVSLFPDN